MIKIPEDRMNRKWAAPGGDDDLKVYFDQCRAIPLLTFEQELELSKKIQQGDEAAKHTLVKANLRLVIKIAHAYRGPEVSFLDLIQEGNIGLMYAAEKYDHAKNVRFSTYANWWIRQSIARYLVNKRRAIRLPQRKEEILRRIQRSYHTLSQTLSRKPSTEEISVEIGVPAPDIECILSMTSGMVSLEAEAGDGESAPAVDLHEDYTYSPERAFMRKLYQDETMRSLDKLKDRERQVIIYRYQLNGNKRHTLKNIGDKMGLSPETVRQIELKALRQIRTTDSELRTMYAAM
jgi:RNA polymerase primary sigma factor